MSSPWKTPERPQAQSFRELMQEQKEDEVNNAEDRDIAMAIKLSMEDSLSVEQRYIPYVTYGLLDSESPMDEFGCTRLRGLTEFCSTQEAFADQESESTDCTSDELLARMLQKKFDEEYVSNQAYPGRTINHPPPVAIPSDEDDYADEQDEQGVYDKAFQIGRKGYACVNGHTITKHDLEMSGHRNMQKLTDNMPLSSTCGDAHTSQVPLSNKIYNDLRRSAFKGNF